MVSIPTLWMHLNMVYARSERWWSHMGPWGVGDIRQWGWCSVDWNDNLCRGDEKNAARIIGPVVSKSRVITAYGRYPMSRLETSHCEWKVWWRVASINHMPRWASRILLEITDVRVERCMTWARQMLKRKSHLRRRTNYTAGSCLSRWLWWYLARYLGQDNWLSNPWVWVIEFKRIQRATSERN